MGSSRTRSTIIVEKILTDLVSPNPTQHLEEAQPMNNQ
jgi:hypothetical protein